MKICSIAAMVLVSLPLLATASHHAAAQLTPAPVVTRPKVATTLTMANASVAVGETKTFPASLTTSAGKGIANKKVEVTIMRLPGKDLLGKLLDETDAEGRASIKFPATFGGAGMNLLLRLKFEGDAMYGESTAQAVVEVTKAPVKINLGEVTMVSGKGPMIPVTLRRATDGKDIVGPISVAVNGKTANLGGRSSYSVMLVPANAPSWDVKADFAGNLDLLPGTQTRTYTRSN